MSFAFFEYTHTTQESQPAPHDGEYVNDGEDNASGNNGEDEHVEVRLHGSGASPFLSILTRHRIPNLLQIHTHTLLRSRIPFVKKRP